MLQSIKLDGCVVDSVKLESENTHGHLSRETLRQVVDEQVNVHDDDGDDDDDDAKTLRDITKH